MDHAGEDAGDPGHLVEGEQGAGQVQHQEDDAHPHHHPRQEDILTIIHCYKIDILAGGAPGRWCPRPSSPVRGGYPYSNALL